jgi:hypothetical protein
LVSDEDLSETRLPWADLSSHFPGAPGRSGGAILVPPDHPDFPPTWLTRCYGPLCVGWPGVEARTFPACEPFSLRYRIWLHQTEVDHARLESVFAAYKSALEASWNVASAAQ